MILRKSNPMRGCERCGRLVPIDQCCPDCERQQEAMRPFSHNANVALICLYVVLTIAGVAIAVVNTSKFPSYDSYSYSRPERVMEDVEEVVEVEEVVSSDGTLLDLVDNASDVRAGRAGGMNVRYLGKSFDPYDYSTSHTKQLTVDGQLDGDSFSALVLLDEDGKLYGRYRHRNGTQLDFNGYLDSDGDLVLQLGHGSEESHAMLRSRGKRNGHWNYSGSWGRRDLDMYMEFREY